MAQNILFCATEIGSHHKNVLFGNCVTWKKLKILHTKVRCLITVSKESCVGLNIIT
jgi:hypothetical protein